MSNRQGIEYKPQRTVLAPGNNAENPPVEVSRSERFVHLEEQDGDDDDFDRIVLTEPEARHLRDWLCEQFGLPIEPCNFEGCSKPIRTPLKGDKCEDHGMVECAPCDGYHLGPKCEWK